MPTQVSDALSNANEQIEHAAKTIGGSNQRLEVFNAIYHGKRQVKSVKEIAESTGLSSKCVLTAGKKLADNNIVEQTKQDGGTAYRKIAFFHTQKKAILTLVKHPKKLTVFPTKRKVVESKTIRIDLQTDRARTRQICIDEIDSFREVKRIAPTGNLPTSVSEKKFKEGIKKILGETGDFTDWGGEKNDLYTTRLKIGRRRFPVAFGFKGPGQTGELTPKKMGKNGDQIQRLFESPATVFLVQYWREIAESIIQQLQMLATAKSVMTSEEILYGVIDGQDSNRLMIAYQSKFS